MELVWYLVLIIIIFSFFGGMASSLAGIGGGVFYVSIMTFFLTMPIKEAIDTSTFIILFASAAGLIMHVRAGRVDIKQILVFSIFSILGGLTCLIMLQFVYFEDFLLKIIFGTLVVYSAVNMFYKANKTRKIAKDPGLKKTLEQDFNVKDYDYKKNFKKAIPLFFSAGFAAYLLGIGGGTINTPVLNIILGYPIHNATATSTGIVFFTAVFNTILKVFYGQINYVIGMYIAIGTILGYTTGAQISGKIPKVPMQYIVGTILLFLGIKMYF